MPFASESQYQPIFFFQGAIITYYILLMDEREKLFLTEIQTRNEVKHLNGEQKKFSRGDFHKDLLAKEPLGENGKVKLQTIGGKERERKKTRK